MKMSDSRIIAAPRAEVWAALLSVDVLKDCVPGCQEMTGTPEDGFEAVVVQKVGPVKATFKGHVTLSEMVEPDRLHLAGSGKGGAAGFAKGGADVSLEAVPEGTKLSYDVEAKVGGKLAQLGSRVIDGFAKKMADQFFERFQAAVEGPGEDQSAEADTAADAGDGAVEGDEKKQGWLKRAFSG